MTAIRVELELKDGSFTSGMLRAGQTMNSFQRELARLDPNFRRIQASGGNFIRSMQRADVETKSLLGTLRDLSVVGGFAALAFSSLTGASENVVGSIIRVNAEMEKLRFQMEGLSSASDPIQDAADNVAYLRDMATRAPFSLRELNSTFVKLKATGTDPLNGSMQALLDGIATFGGTDEQLHRVTLGISQMSGKGVIQMEEMRQQLGESMPNAMQIMARSMGVSVAELTRAIGTGRVQAGPALQGFYEELDRAYGGEAQRMMGTFSGQIAGLAVNLQNLATGGQMAGFFEDVKGYLVELNEFLKTDTAREYADAFGYALRFIASSLEEAARFVYAFRDELLLLAKVAAAGVGLRVLGSALSMVGLAAVRAQGQFIALRTAAASVGTAFGPTFQGPVMAGTAMMGSMAARSIALRAGIIGIATVATATLPWIALIGTALYVAAESMGFFSENTEKAYESLKKFGAENRDQLDTVLAEREAALQAELNSAQRSYDWDFNNARFKKDKQRRIDAAKQALYDFQQEKEEILQKFADDEAEAEIQAAIKSQEKTLDLRINKLNSAYDKEQDLLARKHDADLAAAEKSEEDKKEIGERYDAQVLASRKKLVDEKIKIHVEEIDRLEALYEGRPTNPGVEAQLDYLRSRLTALREQAAMITPESLGIVLMPEGDDENARIERGMKALEGLQDEVKGLQVELEGASSEYAKMQRAVARGDFGSISSGEQAVRELHEALKLASAEKAALDYLMKGRNDVNRDLKNLESDILEREMALREAEEGRDLTEAEKILLRINSGYYQGLGPVENVRKALEGLIGMTDGYAAMTGEAGRVMQETFDDGAVSAIDRITEALGRATSATRGLAGAFGNMDFAGVGGPFMGTAKGGLLDLIADVESNGDYNATLDNGLWTGGPQNLVGMTLNQVRALQQKMLANPMNRARYGDGLGSSALGKYQIVGKTLQGLMDEMGLTGNELFDERMQDEMASRLIARRGRSVEGLRNEWEGLKDVDAGQILAAYDASMTGGPRRVLTPATSGLGAAGGPPSLPAYDPTFFDQIMADRARFQAQTVASLEDLKLREEAADAGEADLARQKRLKELQEGIAKENKSVEELGKNYQALTDSIRAGDLGTNRDVNAAEYAELIAAAKELDAVEARMAEREKEAERAKADKAQATEQAADDLASLERERLELSKQIAEAQARAANPDYVGLADDMRSLNDQLDTYIENVRIAYGEDSQAFKDAQDYKAQILGDSLRLQGEEIAADMAAQTRDIQDGLLTERQLRRVQYDRQLALIDQQAERMRQAGVDEVEIVRQTEAAKAALRDQYAQGQRSQFAEQMRNWGDLKANVDSFAASASDSFASGISNIIMRTGDFRSVLNDILGDLTEIGVKYALSGISGKGGGKSGGAGKAASTVGKVATGGKAGLFGMAHTGGMVGSKGLRVRRADISSMSGAKRYHTGGMIKSGGSRGLMPGERSIIAMIDEGVFTPEQMEQISVAMAGGDFNPKVFTTDQARALGLRRNARKRFHRGGMVGDVRKGWTPSGVAGVNRQSDLQKAAANGVGSQTVTIHSPITVNGSAGTPEQNDDLARKVAREMEGGMRQIFTEEFMRQSRPGNMLNRRG